MKNSQEKIKKSFLKNLNSNESISTLVAFNMAIYKKQYSITDIKKSFIKLVDKLDWQWVSLSDMIDSCVIMTLTNHENMFIKTQ